MYGRIVSRQFNFNLELCLRMCLPVEESAAAASTKAIQPRNEQIFHFRASHFAQKQHCWHQSVVAHKSYYFQVDFLRPISIVSPHVSSNQTHEMAKNRDFTLLDPTRCSNASIKRL